jgi:TrmH family RNA methyltransferase
VSSRTVTSLTNPTVKAVRALHLRKERDETGLFVAEGLKAVIEGVETGHAPRILMHAEAAAHPLLKTAVAATLGAGGEVIEVTEVRDPGTLGTIIRTADAAGCGGVVLVGECCDPYSVEAVRATMGSIFAVPLTKASEAEFAAWRNSWPGSVVGTLLSAEVDHRQADYARPTLILMGNEQQGLPPEMAELCDVNVKIPMRGRADSLNLSVATGIMIYAAA